MATALVPLDTLAFEIRASYDLVDKAYAKYEDLRISAAQRTLEAKKRVEAGEAGPGIKFESWAAINLKRSRSYIYKQLKIAGAPDPAVEAARQRNAVRLQVANHRSEKSHTYETAEPAPHIVIEEVAAEASAVATVETVKQDLLLIGPTGRAEIKRWLEELETAPPAINQTSAGEIEPEAGEPVTHVGTSEDAARPTCTDTAEPAPVPLLPPTPEARPLPKPLAPARECPARPASEPTPLMAVWRAVPEKDKEKTLLWLFGGSCRGEEAPPSTPHLLVDRYRQATEPERRAFRVQLMDWRAAA